MSHTTVYRFPRYDGSSPCPEWPCVFNALRQTAGTVLLSPTVASFVYFPYLSQSDILHALNRHVKSS